MPAPVGAVDRGPDPGYGGGMITVASLYRFAEVTRPRELRDALASVCGQAGVRGTLIVAHEGINGTIAGPRAGIDAVIGFLRGQPGMGDLAPRCATATTLPFARLKVRVKPEIVTMGVPGVDPRRRAGRHVPAGEWDDLLASVPDIALIDTRNSYEVAEGSFAGSVDPGTRHFREFPAWWRANRDALAGRPVAMFCTGGIRCEKATSFALAEGATEVYHLQGGILAYLDAGRGAASLWQGSCFVFDERGAIGQDVPER